MPKYKSIDVDNEDDWELLEFYYQKYAKNEYIIVCEAPQRYGGLEVISPIISEIKKNVEQKHIFIFTKLKVL